MAVYRIKRFSFKEKFKGALRGAALGALSATAISSPFAFDAIADKQLRVKPKTVLKGVLGAGIIGASIGAYNGWKNTKSTSKISASKSIKVDEPTDLKKLFRKYPRLKEMDPFIKNADFLNKLSLELGYNNYDDNPFFVNLAEDLKVYSVLNTEFWYYTKNIRKRTNSNDWIACIGNKIYFNTNNNKFYLKDQGKGRYSDIYKFNEVQKIEKYVDYLLYLLKNAKRRYPKLVDKNDFEKLKQIQQSIRK